MSAQEHLKKVRRSIEEAQTHLRGLEEIFSRTEEKEKEEGGKGSFFIRIITLSGFSQELRCDDRDDVKSVMHRLKDTPFPHARDQYHLIFRGKKLLRGDVLSEKGIRSGDSLFAVLNLKGD